MLQPGDSFGDYRVIKLLGKGGMGSVFLLENAEGVQVAAKILDPATAGDHESRKRFLREAELALGVKHPNLVETYDVGEDPETGLCYILMEYVSGGSLADYLKENGALPIEDAVAVVQAMASVLELARQKGIVHRDIKPGNIMFDAEGTPKLADLGIARGGIGGTETTTVTQTGMMIGTPAYMAPEQMLDAHKVDTRADIYSLGVVFFEMLTGERPNKDDTVVQLMARAVKGEPLPDVRTLRPEVSASLAQLLNMMVAPDKDGRISTPGQITSALDIIARGGTFAAKPAAIVDGRARTPAAPQTNRDSKPIPWKTLIPVILLAGLAVAFAVLAPKREKVVQSVVTTNVVERLVEKTNVVRTVAHTEDEARVETAVRTKDGVYRWKGPEGEWTYRVRNGLASIGHGKGCALYPKPKGRLTIPATIGGLPVMGIALAAFQDCTELTAVEISEGVLEMEHNVFKGCTALTEASLPRSMKKFGRWNFFGTAIRSLDLGRIDYWDGRIIGGMTNLVELKFDSFNDDFVCEGDMVLNKDKTRLLFLPSTRSELKLPKSVTTLDTWAMCRADVTIPGQIRRVEQMAFGNCHALRSVRFESPDVSIGHHAFLHAENLRRVDFPEGVREVDSCKVFSSCSSLREIRFPGSLRKLGAELFSNCSSLRKVAFDGDAPELVDDGRYRGANIFIGTPRDLVVCVKRGSRGWNPGGEGLPKMWPVGAGENARRIRYDDGKEQDAKPEVSSFDWLEKPKERLQNAEVVVGFCPKWQKPEAYFRNVLPGTNVRYVQNREMESCDLKNVVLAFMFSCDAPDYEIEAKNVSRCLESGVDVVFVAHTPNDVRERLLGNYGLRFNRMSDGVALEGVCPGLRDMPIRWLPMGQGCILRDDLGWRAMITAGRNRRNVILAMRPCGRGRLFFLAESRRPKTDGERVDFQWWDRVMRGCGIGVRAPSTVQKDRSIGAEKLKDPDQTRVVQKTLDALFPGWKTSEAGGGQELGYRANYCGVDDVLRSHPPCRGVPVTFSKTVTVAGKHPILHVRLSNHAEGRQFRLRVRVGGMNVREKDIVGGWTDVYVDLERWRGKKVKIELEHLPTGWCQEWAYWSEIEIVDDATLVEVAAVQGAETPVKILDRRQVVGTNPKKAAQRTCDALFPGWKISECGHPDEAGYEEEHAGRYNLLFTHPPREDEPVVLSRRMNLPRKAPKLYVSVIGGEDFELQVKVNGKIVQRPDVNGREWTDLTVDLSEWAGRNVLIELLNMPTGWQHEEAHWQRLEIR